MNSEILYITKENEKNLSTEDVMKVFLNSDDMQEIREAVEKAEQRIYVSWATVEMKDRAGEIIPIDDVIKQQETLIRRGGAISADHSNRFVGKLLAYKVLTHPKTGTRGVLHLNKIYADNIEDNKVWGEILNGTRKGSSVGGVSSGSQLDTMPDGSPVKTILGFQQMETATVENPCNPLALNEAFSVVAKSAGDTNNQTQNKMVEEKTKTVAAAKANETIKEDGDEMQAEVAEVSLSDVMGVLSQIMDRFDNIEAAMSGKPEEAEEIVEEKVEEPKEEDPKEEDKAADEDPKEDEEEDPKEDFKKLKKELDETKKELNVFKTEKSKKEKVVQVIKSARPSASAVEEKVYTATDIANGVAKFDGEKIVKKN